MNCPVRSDPLPDEGHNQNPPALAPELTTNNSMNHRANDTTGSNAAQIDLTDGSNASIDPNKQDIDPVERTERDDDIGLKEETIKVKEVSLHAKNDVGSDATSTRVYRRNAVAAAAFKVKNVLVKYAKFIGPGIMISVAYIDPGESVSGLCKTICI